MSIINNALTFFGIGPSRSFGGISGYVTLSENTLDEIEITQQPVQQGATIADHAFKKPVSFSIQMLFSDNLNLTSISSFLSVPSLSNTYQALLTLQSSLTPFTCVTPKRSYPNMLMKSLACTTDKKTENVLSITAAFEEVILVPVVSTLVSAASLRNPAANLGVAAVGNKSAALSLVQGIGSLFGGH